MAEPISWGDVTKQMEYFHGVRPVVKRVCGKEENGEKRPRRSAITRKISSYRGFTEKGETLEGGPKVEPVERDVGKKCTG